jgi:hypothetical protein
MALVSMKRTPEELADLAQDMIQQEPAGYPELPYGLCLQITEAELRKMGWADPPKAGDTVKITALAFVRTVNTSADGDEDDPDTCCHMQITDMDMTAGKPRKSAAQTLYGGADDD